MATSAKPRNLSYRVKGDLKCPICDFEFQREQLHSGGGRLIAGKLTEELRRLYQPSKKYGKVYPAAYALTVCPSCLFTSFPNDFKQVPAEEIEAIQKRTVQRRTNIEKVVGPVDFNDDRNLVLGAASYLLGIDCYQLRGYQVAPTPKKPSRSRCSWNGRKAEPIPEFSVTEPLVFHLHGYWDDFRSLVLTESDYVDFLVSLTRDADKRARNQAETLPPQIRERLSDTGLLFLGYGLEDWNFRVIHRALVLDQALSGQERSIAVQLDPGGAGADFVRQYLDKLGVDVYFGTANEFIEELM